MAYPFIKAHCMVEIGREVLEKMEWGYFPDRRTKLNWAFSSCELKRIEVIEDIKWFYVEYGI